jgi:hypothetical protein
MRVLKIFCLVFVLALGAVKAQPPAPIIVQAASAAPAASKMSAPAAGVTSVPEAIKMLEQVKATNDEVLAKQKAALQRLDELQEAAEQLRIFAKRG